MDILDQALGGETPAEQVATPADQNDAAGGPARGADGKFVSAHADAAPVLEPAPAPAPEASAEAAKPDQAPEVAGIYRAMMDERDKRKAAEDRLKALEQQQLPAAQPPELDPDTENALLQLRLNTSEELVRDKEGDETVDAAKAWAVERFRINPAYQQEVLAKPNPYKFVVAEHKAHLKMEAAKDLDLSDLEAFKAWKAAGGQSAAPPAPQPAAAAPVAPAPATPPRSIADAPNAGGRVDTTPAGPGTAFDSVIK